jgi:putative MFS transporter
MGMMALIMVGAPLGVFIASKIIDEFPRKGLSVSLLLIIGMLGYFYSLQRSETLIVIFGFVLTVVIYVYVCLACSVYVPEMWPTEARLRGAGVANAIGRISAIFSPYGVAWLLSNYGSIAVFIGLGGVLVLLATIIATLGVETRYKSLEQISREVGV